MTAAEEVPAPAQMLQLLAGFQISQALFVVASFGVPAALADGPLTVDELAAETGANADALQRIIRALTPVGIFRSEGDRIAVTPLGLTLAEGHPGSVRDMALFWMETHYAPFADLVRTVRTGEAAAPRYYGMPTMEWTARSPEMTELQTRAMASVTQGLKGGMFDGYSLPAGDLVADIGGADGTVLCRLLAGEPHRRGIVFDKPAVVPAAREVLARHGLSGRARIQPGDFFESVPAADVYILSSVIGDWDDESCLTILRNITKAADLGARLVIIDAVIPPGDGPHPAKLIDLTMLAMGTGRQRTAGGYGMLLDAAGFTLDRIISGPSLFSFIEATLR